MEDRSGLATELFLELAVGDLNFVFQAEDGIRDGRVTGVQTCALPISTARRPTCTSSADGSPTSSSPAPRSEERRVGKECRSQWEPYYYKKKVTSAIFSMAT